MLRKSIGNLFIPAGVLALAVLAASAQERKMEENTPGATLQFQRPAGLVSAPTMPYSGAAYQIRADGFPRGEKLHLWFLLPGTPLQSATPMEVGLALNGLVVEWGTTTPVTLFLPSEPKGMVSYIGLTTTDRSVRFWTRFRPYPIQVRNGPCQMSAEVASGLGQAYSLSGSGFQPGEDLRITTEWLKEAQEGHGTARSDGTWEGRVTLADTGRRSLKAKVTIEGQNCTLKLGLESINPRPKG